MKLKNLKACVEYVLERYPETRNDDLQLTVQLWKSFCKNVVHEDGMIHISDIKNLPREEHICRIRRKFNEDGKYLPDEKVKGFRQQMEEEWRKQLSYNHELRQA